MLNDVKWMLQFNNYLTIIFPGDAPNRFTFLCGWPHNVAGHIVEQKHTGGYMCVN